VLELLSGACAHHVPAPAALIQVKLLPQCFLVGWEAARQHTACSGLGPAHHLSRFRLHVVYAVLQVLELEDPSCQVGRRVRVKSQPTSLQLSKSGSGGWFK
jgi:hypothetical protein